MKNLLGIFLTVLLVQGQNLSADVEGIVFIVNAKNPTIELSAANIREFYFKKKRQWPEGENVRFIDRATGSSVREIFLKRILKKTSSEADLYWIGQKLYSGDSAPLREAADGATVQFVSSFTGAIGYVSSTSVLTSKNVKFIKIKDE